MVVKKVKSCPESRYFPNSFLFLSIGYREGLQRPRFYRLHTPPENFAHVQASIYLYRKDDIPIIFVLNFTDDFG